MLLKRKRGDDEPDQDLLRNQFYCVNGNSGYAWMVNYMPTYDELPRIVRERLQQSPFNICTACLRACLPGHDLLSAIEIREYQIRSRWR